MIHIKYIRGKKISYKNFSQFSEIINDEVCIEYLENKLWWDGSPTCPFCWHEKSYKFKDGRTYKCAKCRKKYNIKIHTFFENTKIPLNKWFWAFYRYHTISISSSQLHREMNITQTSAWKILQKVKLSIFCKTLILAKLFED